MRKLIVAAFILLSSLACMAQEAKPVSKLDDMQFRGSYYQIARLPDKKEKHCIGNAVEMVARGDKLNEIDMVDSCKTKGSYADVRNTKAKRQNKKIDDGRLKITTFWPLSRRYWVLATAPDYSWFLSGTPNHKNLWIYAKSPALDDAQLNEIKALATSSGYNLAKLISQPEDVTAGQGKLMSGQATGTETGSGQHSLQ